MSYASEEAVSYRPAGSLVTALTGLMIAGALLQFIGVGFSFLEYQLLADAVAGQEISTERAEANDQRQQLLALVHLGLLLVTAVMYFKWTHRMVWNARQVSGHQMEISPGWAVGYFFVPILNLWRPYQAIRQAYDTFQEGSRREDKGYLLGFWWGLWLLTGFLGQVSLRTGLKAKTAKEMMFSTSMDIASSLAGIVLAAAAILMIWEVTAACREKFEPDPFSDRRQF